jgi:hypothetical protein
VLDSDATLILFRGELTGGSLLTRTFCQRHGKPHLEIDAAQTKADVAVEQIVRFVERHGIATLTWRGRDERLAGRGGVFRAGRRRDVEGADRARLKNRVVGHARWAAFSGSRNDQDPTDRRSEWRSPRVPVTGGHAGATEGGGGPGGHVGANSARVLGQITAAYKPTLG